ncbi:MAG: hypothetical protein KC733_01660, partial [Candidatus Omnitrophica bacterium]|nr:hypothetical protein [Candidatus Omnitrophota bacterium]
MIIFRQKNQFKAVYRVISLFLVFIFGVSPITPISNVSAQSSVTGLNLPAPGAMVQLSPVFQPAVIKGLKILPQDPFRFDFIIDTGDSQLEGDDFRGEADKLIKYFLTALTIPEEDLWVNLSPYEKNRIVPNQFGVTEMGRDLLAQDYLLKQITSSLIYPEDELGETFWNKIYSKSQELYGTSDIPMNTFNKVWIVPEKATIYENGDTVFVAQSHLKVLLEEDYVALDHNSLRQDIGTDQLSKDNVKEVNDVSSELIKEIILPEIEREVNEGKNFAQLRQIYNAVILATWFKENLKESVLGKIYVGQNHVGGVEAEDRDIKEKIYQQYLEAFKVGVFDFIKEDYDAQTQQIIPRKYFSGGAVLNPKATGAYVDEASSVHVEQRGILKTASTR